MEITSTTVTRTACHKTASTIYNIDYSIRDGRLDRIGLNIQHQPHDGKAEEYLGSVHFDGCNVSCHLPLEDGMTQIFEQAVGFITEIIGEASSVTAPESTDNKKQR